MPLYNTEFYCTPHSSTPSISPGTVKLQHVPRPRMKICVLGDAVHCEAAQKIEMPFKSVDDLKKLNKNKKMVKK